MEISHEPSMQEYWFLMKQVTQTLSSGDVQIAEVPPPSLQPGGVLVRNAFSLISSGTERAKVELARKSLVGKAQSRPDQVMQAVRVAREQSVMAAFRKVSNRLSSLEPLGYSCAGRVIAVSPDVQDFQVGDNVACAGSGYANHAEVVFIPKNLCAKLPPQEPGQCREIGLEEAAFATLGAIALQGVRQAEPRIGETIVVMGLGLVGLLTVQLLQGSGCRVMGLDPNPKRGDIATSFGCWLVAQDPDRLIRQLRYKTGGIGADAVLLTAASDSTELMILAGEACHERAKVVVVGDIPIHVPRSPYYEKELDVRLSRSYGPGRYDPEYEDKGRDYPVGYVRWTEQRNLEAFLTLVAQDKVQVKPLITHRFDVNRALDAYQMILEESEPSLGVLLEYPLGITDAAGERHPSSWPRRTSKSAAAGKQGAIGIALIGGGNFAQDTLLPVMKSLPGVHFRSVVTRSGLRAHDIARRFSFDYSSTDLEQALADSSVQAVVIATRHDTHADFALRALKAGKAVYVEKPLVLNQQQLDEIAEFWQQTVSSGGMSPLLMVGFNRRFAPAIETTQHFLDAVMEPLVMTCRVNAGSLPPQHWLHDPDGGGGRLIGEGCHFVDLLMFLARSYPLQVFAQALPDGGLYREENVVAQFRYANGSLATLAYVANGDKRAGKEYIEIFGGGATAIVDDFRQVILRRPSQQQKVGGRWAKQDKGHRPAMQRFLGAVAKGEPSPTPLEELLIGAAATLAVVESFRTGAPVQIDSARYRMTTAK
jgi:predicted dehydrogenase/threonine dehydrogenase-like Zn-dependent dehydrogenase